MIKSQGYNAELDMFRFAFAMIIAWFHLTHFSGVALTFPGTEVPLIRLIGGYMATDFFFIVSGAMLARHAQNRAGKPMVAAEPLRYCYLKYEKTLSVFLMSLVVALLLDRFIIGAGLMSRSGNPLDIVWEVLCLHMSGAGNGYLISDPDWYLSALLLGCLVVYPVCRRHLGFTMNYLGPVASLLLYGYLIKTYGHLCVNFSDFRLVYPALVRAVAGLLLGCFVWQCAQKLAALKLTCFGRWSVTFVEMTFFLGLYVLFTIQRFTRNDLLSVLLLAGLCVLVLSGQSGLGTHLYEKPAHFLSNMSRSVFFSHFSVYHYFSYHQLSTPNRTFVAFTVGVLGLALAVLVLSTVVEKFVRATAPKLKRWFVVEDRLVDCESE